MADAPQLTTDQYNFCRAVEAMKLDLLRRRHVAGGKEAAWLVAYPGVLELVLGQVDGQRLTEVRVCGLGVLESESCPPGSFYLTHRRPLDAPPQ